MHSPYLSKSVKGKPWHRWHSIVLFQGHIQEQIQVQIWSCQLHSNLKTLKNPKPPLKMDRFPMSCTSGWRQVRIFQIFECWVRARGKYEIFRTYWVRVGGKRVSLSGHHWIYPYICPIKELGGGFACKSNIRITLAYSSDMSTGIESTYQLGMTQGNTILMPVPIWYGTWGNTRFIPALYQC